MCTPTIMLEKSQVPKILRVKSGPMFLRFVSPNSIISTFDHGNVDKYNVFETGGRSCTSKGLSLERNVPIRIIDPKLRVIVVTSRYQVKSNIKEKFDGLGILVYHSTRLVSRRAPVHEPDLCLSEHKDFGET